MKIRDTFIGHDFEEERILVDTGDRAFQGMIRVNKTAAFIIDCLRTDTTERAIIDCMLAKYEVSREKAEKDVKNVIEKLKGIGAIDE